MGMAQRFLTGKQRRVQPPGNQSSAEVPVRHDQRVGSTDPFFKPLSVDLFDLH
jgi:hypothetical protein